MSTGLMWYKTILTAAISLESDMAALAAAKVLACAGGGQMVAVVVSVHPASEFSRNHAAFSYVLEDIARFEGGETATAKRNIETWLNDCGAPFEQRTLLAADALAEKQVVVHARHADLTVLTRPIDENDNIRAIMWESILFGSGRPVLLAPPGWQGEELGRRILIGWNAKREASRAIADAIPLIAKADVVKIVTVDAAPGHAGHGECPGHDAAKQLARHGAFVEVENLAGDGDSVAQCLIRAANAMDADLIVMGGYGHSRTTEWLLGGTTREMAFGSTLPVLMSH